MKSPHTLRLFSVIVAGLLFPIALQAGQASENQPQSAEVLPVEKLEETWVDPALTRPQSAPRIRVVVWFEDQFLGSGDSYQKRAKEFASWKRTELRSAVMRTLKHTADESFKRAEPQLSKLIEAKTVSGLERFWIVNGFRCSVDAKSIDQLKAVPGVRRIFLSRGRAGRMQPGQAGKAQAEIKTDDAFDISQFKHPWYVRHLLADRVWTDLKTQGAGTLNVVHDFNFVFSKSATASVYRNPNEIPDNGKDDDGNGYIDDVHGYDFDRGSANLTRNRVAQRAAQPQLMHGYMCAMIICGRGVPGGQYEFGIAPRARWAGVMASNKLEKAIEWASEQGADTYSMSFSMPNLGQYRSHWRKVMEHGSFCGIYFVSGAGNFARSAPIPVQMRTPEDIPEVVFAAAGVQRNLARTPFSSKGPVEWKTHDYQDGRVAKPEVCAFNMGLPLALLNGQVRDSAINGNSFAGPMFCGSIALMLSADPELLPWDLKEIITSTATDIGPQGIDDETGHGLINCYRAVREVMRRKAVREGRDPSPYEGRQENDQLDVQTLRTKLKSQLVVANVIPETAGAKAGIQRGDVVVKVGDQDVKSMQEFARTVQRRGQNKLAIQLKRDGETVDVELGPGRAGFAVRMQVNEPSFK